MTTIRHFIVELRPFKSLRTIHPCGGSSSTRTRLLVPEPGEDFGPIIIGSSDPALGDKFATVEEAQRALESARSQTVVESPRIVAVYAFSDGDGEYYRPIS